jgi:hypothetical protein
VRNVYVNGNGFAGIGDGDGANDYDLSLFFVALGCVEEMDYGSRFGNSGGFVAAGCVHTLAAFHSGDQMGE